MKIGDNVFVSGGIRKNGESEAIFQYSINEDSWITLPHCRTSQQSLATMNDELIAIGGIRSSGKATNAVYTFGSADGKWKKTLPRMPTPRYRFSTVSHNNEVIIAAGGITGTTNDGKVLGTEIVEIYIRDDQWYVTKGVPIRACAFTMSILNDTCYMLGGTGMAIARQCTHPCQLSPTMLYQLRMTIQHHMLG